METDERQDDEEGSCPPNVDGTSDALPPSPSPGHGTPSPAPGHNDTETDP